MKKKKSFILSLYLISLLFSTLICPSFADQSLDLKLYHHEKVTKNGRQYHENAWEEHDGRHILMLVANKDQLLSEHEIHRGTPIFASFESSDQYALYVNDTHNLENGELVICIDTDDALEIDQNQSYDISLDFYTDDLSAKIYTSKIKNVPAEEVAVIPQTGDNAVSFVFIAVASLILMAFILAPKKRRAY